jgi:glyoxylase-like metal-dependent hydrolase (beta-lactamase superfamily II)
MKKIQKNIYYHTTRDGLNIGLIVGDDGVVCVDLPMSVEETTAWKAQIREISELPIRALIYTSADRVSFEAIESLGAPVIIHDAARAQLYTPVEVAAANPFDATITMITPAQNKHPEMSFSESTALILGSEKHPAYVDVTHQGGHSNGAVFVTLRDSGVIFAGEHVAVGQPPLIAQGNFARWADVLAALKKNKAVQTVIPGRGAHGGPDLGAETLDYIKQATAKVKAHIRSRRSRNEVVQLIPPLLAIYNLNEKTAAKLHLNIDLVRINVRAGLERLFDDHRSEA